MQKLVFVGKIVEIAPIEKADNIVSATVVCGEGGKWRGVVKKNEFLPNDLCRVYLPDAILPDEPEFEFMRKHGFRIRQQKLRGAVSEVLLTHAGFDETNIGSDITEKCRVTKYEKPIDPSVAGDILGPFPGFIPKTNELNFQTARHLVEALNGKAFYATVKLDGSSGTFYKYNGHIGACSRNLEMKDTPKSLPWVLAREHGLVEKMPDGFAIQFEMCGPKIQGNPMSLEKKTMFVFDLYNIREHRYENVDSFVAFCKEFGLHPVSLCGGGIFDASRDLQERAAGQCPNGAQREGIVIRPTVETLVDGERLSFKVINLNYKD